MEITLTNQNFNDQVLQSKLPTLVDFWAVWCGPCQVQNPILEQFATAMNGKVAVGKVNVDENQDLAGQYNVMSIPTLIVFKDGKEVSRMIGVQSEDKLKEEIAKISS